MNNNPFERALVNFQAESAGPDTDPVQESKPKLDAAVSASGSFVSATESPKSPNQETSLVPPGKQELMNPFALARELFNFAGQKLPEHAGDRYSDLNGEFADNPYATELPEMFYSLISDYPGKYWVVLCEDRIGSHNKIGTRSRLVRLSTVSKLSEGNDKIREIDIEEPDPTNGFGNVQFMSVKDSVMNQERQHLNLAPKGEVNAPHGSAKLKYKLGPTGKKELIESEFSRLDEGLFDVDGAETPVRWLRDLYIHRKSGKLETEYRDIYIIDRHDQREDHRDAQVRAKIKATGDLENPETVTVFIGSELGGKNEILFEDAREGVKVILGDNEAWTSKERIVETLKQDPNYAFIFEGGITREKILELLKRKNDMLANDWDKQAHVFAAALDSSDVPAPPRLE